MFNKIKKYFKKKGKLIDESIRIGDDTFVYNSKLYGTNSISNNCFIANCSIGEFTYIAENSSIINAEVGKFCSIARNVGIGLGKHPTKTFVSTHPSFFSPLRQCGNSFVDTSFFKESDTTKIGNDVWIGTNVVVMDGINIGHGAILGAGTIVTKDVPPYAIVVGSPAKIIRYRFDQEQINFLLKFQWWNKDVNWLKENVTDFHNIDTFINKYNNDNN